MTNRPIQILSRIFGFWAIVAVVLASSVRGDDSSVGYDYYKSPDAMGYAALGISSVDIPNQEAPEVVFLVDTSASQMGQTRKDTFLAIQAALAFLPEGTMVELVAIDVEADSLTQGFVEKDSYELNSAIQELNSRVPMGATDLGQALESAVQAFEDRDENTKRAVLYFGDGRSMAKTVDQAKLQGFIKEYNENKIPFTACSIGAQTNLGLLAVMANHTGGNLVDLNTQIQADLDVIVQQAEANQQEYVDMPNFAGKVGQDLAQSVMATVVWPDSLSYSFPEGWNIFPKVMQPLRSDRATIILAETSEDAIAPFDLNVNAVDYAGNPVQLTWTLTPNNQPGTQKANRFLAPAVKLAQSSDLLPIVGWESVDMLRDGYIANVDDKLKKADAALKIGSPEQAVKLMQDLLNDEPDNKRAQKLLEQGEKEFAAQETGNESFDPNFDDDSSESSGSYIPSMLGAVVTERSAENQKLANEVRYTISQANALATSDPEGAIQMLKLMLSTVRDNATSTPADRNAMLAHLGNALKQVEHTQYLHEMRQYEIDANEAQRNERVRSLQALEENRTKAIQIFDRFASLMEAGEYKIATRVAETAAEILPNDTTPFTAQRLASMTDYAMEYNELRHKRHVGFIETLMITERSFIPIPEEPPLTYIDPEKWLLLSDKRKDRYAVADLSNAGEAEKKITKALDKNIDLELDENSTFEDLFTMIKDKNPGMNIGIDPKGAGALGITTGTAIVRDPIQYHGIKLRSALRLILGEHDLTYCIKDEVLLITSEDEAQKYMSVKVYPMADLVIDPTPIQGGSAMGGMGGGMGGMMNGGGMGGMGGGMGGMGGGMGGMGGGMGGMGGGMGGGGGGMWNVPDSIRRLYGASQMNGKAANGFGGGFFSVPDITREQVAKAKSLCENAEKANEPKTFWNAYFASENVDDEIVKDVVKRFKEKMETIRKKEALAKGNQKDASASKDTRNEDQVIALVEAAILNDKVQPWMYEAMALSMYSKGAPKKQLERAILSAADFCDNPEDLMNIGLFMESVGLKERAFLLYKQVLEVTMPRREFYESAMRAAEDGDEENLKWIALVIISMEWDGLQGKKMHQQALDNLAMLKRRMEKTGRIEEAKALEMEMREAQLRDCVVTVQWTGNAGLSVVVREPADSFCWYGNPRSLSGGLLKKATMTQNAGIRSEVSGVKTITYVCPRGFNGTYAVTVDRDWGEISNNLINVSVDTQVVAGEESTQGTAYEIGEKGVLVYFDLENGRRTESASQAEVEIVQDRLAKTQQNLARNNALKQLEDFGVLAQLSGNNDSSFVGGSGQSPPSKTGGSRWRQMARNMDYLYGPSAVGYRPVITMLNIGASLTSNAVVSADRRYVRMSPSPMMNSLRNVYKFNMATGGEGTSDRDSNSNSGSNNNSSNRNN